MASGLEGTIHRMTSCVPAVSAVCVPYDQIYQDHRHRVYSLAFWMTGNELAAEQLSSNTFLRAFAAMERPTLEQIDRAFVTEVRDLVSVGTLTLTCPVTASTSQIYGNIKRTHLEQAVLALPATEKLIFLLHDVEGYEHGRIAILLGMSEKDSRQGLHQARLQVRSLVARML